MTQQAVLDYLEAHGETRLREIKIDGVTPKALSNILSRLVDANKVIRHELGGRQASYSVMPTPVEPDYSVILRNLPREAPADE
jgi:DNA-binding HxlR family transcriptional regulator